MYDFILQISMMVSLGIFLYVFARALPRLSQVVEVSPSEKGLIDRWISKLPLEKMDAAWNSFFEKFLRRVRLLLLRADNFLHGHISKMKEASEKSATVPIAEIKELKKEDVVSEPEIKE